MRWDRLFDDLEIQASAEWEAERAALDSESERVRLSRVTARERLITLGERGTPLRLDLRSGASVDGAVVAVGADWLAVGRAAHAVSIVPLDAIVGVRMPHEDLLGSAAPRSGGSLRERLGLGFLLRDLARRRVPLLVESFPGGRLAGTIDRAGADHLDLALHEPGSARHPAGVTGFRMLLLAHVTQVILDAEDAGL